MVLVDTSVWVEHLRKGYSLLEKLLLDTEVVSHPFIVGELACGNIKNRVEFLSLIRTLPVVPVIEHDEFLYFVDRNKLMGRGLGFVDVHLLASALIAGAPLWTFDKKLKSTAEALKAEFRYVL